MYFGIVVYSENVNVSKLFFSNDSRYNRNESNIVNISNAEVLSNHPSGLTRTLAVRLSVADFNEMTSKGICTANNSVTRNCFLSLDSGFTTSFYNVPTRQTRGFSCSTCVRVIPPGI